MYNYTNQDQIRWYQKWWGVVLISIFVVLSVLLVYFAVITGQYYFKIKQGQGAILQKQFYGGFNQSINGAINTTKIKRKEIETNDDPFLGNPGAKLVIVEFVDFKCPNCKKSAITLKKIMDSYSSKVKLILRDFPAESLHPGSNQIAELAFCARQQGRFWDMHDAIFAVQGSLPANLGSSAIKSLSDEAGTDFTKLKDCFNKGLGKAEINKDYTDGIKFGVKGTPTFFVNGQKVEGSVPYSSWEKVIKKF